MLRHSGFFRHMETAFGQQLLDLRTEGTGHFCVCAIQMNTHGAVDLAEYEDGHVSPEQHES